jgi:hypothetical protein
MRSEKAWYWLTAGVLALGLNGAYQDGQLKWVHCLTSRTAALVDRVSERGLHLMSMAEVMLGSSPETMGRTEAAIQRIQTKAVCDRMARAQRQIAMAQVREQLAEARMQSKMDLAQMKMDRVRVMAIDRANRFRNCDGFSKVVVDLPNLPKVDISNLPNIEIPDLPEVDVMMHGDANGPI